MKISGYKDGSTMLPSKARLKDYQRFKTVITKNGTVIDIYEDGVLVIKGHCRVVINSKEVVQ
jgi:flagellar basal body L-ring protein FlgH